MPDSRLLTLTTHRYTQNKVRDAARQLFDRDSADLERLLPVFDNAGISARHCCVPLEWYMKPHGGTDRSQLFRDHATNLLVHATLASVERAGLRIGDIDAAVAVSTTGVATPSLDAPIIEGLGLPVGVC